MIAATYQNALMIDLCTLLLCAAAAFRCTSSFLHPAAIMLGAHMYIVTLRLSQLARGYLPMSYSFTWPINEAEIVRGVFASDAALVAMALGWLTVHFWGRRNPARGTEPRIHLSDTRIRSFAAGALAFAVIGMAILGPHAQRSVTGDHSGGTSGYLLATGGWAGWCSCLLIYRYGFNWALSLFAAFTLLIVMLLSTFRGAVIIPCVFLLFVWLARRRKPGLPWAVLPALVCLWLLWLPMKPTVYAFQQGQSPADALGVGVRTAFTNFGSDQGSGIDFQFLDMVSSTMTLVDVHDGYFYGGSISPLFVSPIPRQLWEAKPELNQYQFELDVPSRAMAKLHMTAGLIGEAYADFGYFGVVLIPFGISVAFSAAYRRLFGTSLLTPGCLLYFIYLTTYMQLYRDGLISAVWFPFVHCAPIGFAAISHWIWPPGPQPVPDEQGCFPSSAQSPIPC